MVTLYGIKNCDTCRKALKWMKEREIEHEFHDFRADGLDADTLSGWIDLLGWETLLNRRGTTWRNLPEAERDTIDEQKAHALILENPTLIKRPVIDRNGALSVGFNATVQASLENQG